MERLLFSSSILHKVYMNPIFLLPLSGRFEGRKRKFSASTRIDSKRLSYFFCKYDHSSLSSLSSSSPFSVSPKSSAAVLDSPQQLLTRSDCMKKAGDAPSQQRQVIAIVSALIVLLTHSALAPLAFATFQNHAKPVLPPDLLSSAWTGFLAGCLHTLSGPDHLAALAPLSIGRSPIESGGVGALWGCGHNTGQVIFGLVFLLLKDRLHIEVIRTWGTRVVGFTLLIIGAMGIREASEAPIPCVTLGNGHETLIPGPVVGKKKKIGFATFATGILHGLQPDALMMVLPALALPSRMAGAAFLGMFLVGTVVAMGSYTVFIGSCSEALKDRIPRITEKLTWVSSLVAICLGFAIVVSQFFGFSLY